VGKKIGMFMNSIYLQLTDLSIFMVPAKIGSACINWVTDCVCLCLDYDEIIDISQ
jgi:hypothetical protein